MQKEGRLLFAVKAMLLAGILLLVPAATIYAFHQGGVGYCEGCHDLHKPNGQPEPTASETADNTTRYMLKGPDASSTCLLCHAEEGKYYNVLTKDGSQYVPGGDFYWLEKTFTAMAEGKFYRSEGANHGHNIVAVAYGLFADSVNGNAPGDIYPSHAMSCISCHDPHGKTAGSGTNGKAISVSGSYGQSAPDGTIAGNYRLLGGVGYNGGSQSNISFASPAPVAVASSDWTETDANHTAYGSGMSEWCGNCHGSLLDQVTKHPSGNNARLSSVMIMNYNSYVKTGNIYGTEASAYLSLVPFELGTSDSSLLDPSSTSGPGGAGNANVMCLTCHRAHASAFENIGRWDFQSTFIADSHPKTGDGGVTGNDVVNSYYGRDMVAIFGKYQRQLCNKCHMLD